MKNLRRQSIPPEQPFEFHIAADARMSQADYGDDQAWLARLGSQDESAIAMQSQFGGRAGLASLALCWRVGNLLIRKRQNYARPPSVTAFAPNFIQIEAGITSELELVASFIALDSHVSAGQLSLRNTGEDPLELQFELLGSASVNDRKARLNVLTMEDLSLALHLGQIGNLNPVAVVDGASHDIYGWRIKDPKLGMPLAIVPGGETTVKFAVAGLPDMRDAYSLALNWLSRPWQPYLEQIDRAAAALPKINSGSPEWDLLLDLSYAQLLKSFMSSTAHLPHASMVANRVSNRGWSRRGDGSDHVRAWAGQDPTLAYLALPALVSVDAELAKSLIRNWLFAQEDSGHIDNQPGLGGQRQGPLMLPILARLCQQLVDLTGDRDFADEVLPGLVSFFGTWMAADADEDGAPEWQSERQQGYIAFPTFGSRLPWAQGADIQQMETPDLLAYLISEADALVALGAICDDEAIVQVLTEQRDELEAKLEEFWTGERYSYRDRDSHLTSVGALLLDRGAGDQIHEISQELPVPARLMIRVVGGRSQVPRITLKLEGRDADGAPCHIEAPASQFQWQNRQGNYTSEAPFSYVERISVEGLSRVYKVYASAIDSSRLDINALLPLWTGRLPKERAEALVKLAMDEEHFLRPKGLTMVSASDRNYDPSNARGGGGIWLYWLTLVCQGMIKAGYREQAATVLKRVLDMQSRTLARDGKLARFYHADEAKSFGDEHHVGGIAPLSLLHDLIGIRILSAEQAWLGGDFVWQRPVSVEQHGVAVSRSEQEIRIEFPSGHSQSLPADAPWQLVTDPGPLPADERPEPPEAPDIILPSQAESEKLSIKVDAPDSPADDQPPPSAPDDDERH